MSLKDSISERHSTSHPVCASWLEKQPEWRLGWDKRYFMLDGCRLEYRIERMEPPKKACTVISFDKEALAGEPFSFRVWLVEGGSWTLRGDNQETYFAWLRSLEAALAKERPSNAVPRVSDSPSLAADAVAALTSSAHGSGDGGKWNIPPHPTGEGRSAASIPSNMTGSNAADTRLAALPNREVLLTAVVEKQTAWTLRWNPRVIELREGCQMVYREINGDARKRYVLVGVDRAPEKSHEAYLFFTTSIGEVFWVNFATVEECEDWYLTVRRELRCMLPWHWWSIKGSPLSNQLRTGGGGSAGGFSSIFSRLMEKRSAVTTPLNVHYHCATVISSPGGWNPRLIVFGGCTKFTPVPAVQPSSPAGSRVAMPSCELSQLTNACVSLSLRGNLQVQIINVEPYLERPTIKVKPPVLFGSSLTPVVLRYDSSTVKAKYATASSSAVVKPFAIVLGGISGQPQLLPHTEIWGFGISASAHAPVHSHRDANPELASRSSTARPSFWQKWLVASTELPPLAFHSAVSTTVPPLSYPNHDGISLTTSDEEAEEGSNGRLSNQYIVVTGGVDHLLRCVSDVYTLSWKLKEDLLLDQRPKERVIVQRSMASLPQPRAFHGSGVLKDGSIVVVGGRSTHVDLDPVLVLRPVSPASSRSAEKQSWSRVQWANGKPLPLLADVAVAVTSTGESLVVLGQIHPEAVTRGESQVKLYIVHLELTKNGSVVNGSWEDVGVRMGAVPTQVCGCSIHIHEGYVYVIGGAQVMERKTFALCGPLRALMG